MTLIDTAPVVALLDVRDRDHILCLSTLPALRSPLITTLAVITEAMHLLKASAGWTGQDRLHEWIETGRLSIFGLDELRLGRCRGAMQKYRDAPMDFADSTLLIAAEDLQRSRIFTLDQHFYAYRINGTGNFEVIPSLR